MKTKRYSDKITNWRPGYVQRAMTPTEAMAMAMMYWSPRKRLLILYKSKQDARESLAVMRAHVKVCNEPLLTGDPVGLTTDRQA